MWVFPPFFLFWSPAAVKLGSFRITRSLRCSKRSRTQKLEWGTASETEHYPICRGYVWISLAKIGDVWMSSSSVHSARTFEDLALPSLFPFFQSFEWVRNSLKPAAKSATTTAFFDKSWRQAAIRHRRRRRRRVSKNNFRRRDCCQIFFYRRKNNFENQRNDFEFQVSVLTRSANKSKLESRFSQAFRFSLKVRKSKLFSFDVDKLHRSLVSAICQFEAKVHLKTIFGRCLFFLPSFRAWARKSFAYWSSRSSNVVPWICICFEFKMQTVDFYS